ncbi:spore coat protein [Siminovitchia acidinfaciens]|uniref:Spore coat protein n=1 Tax=Siminovitchia acidinfaciens TaxID=2321395 RepID=A0A429XV73_9BACI|nr:glycosyltransferase [Siminovitchia acidinfaciens]RST72089.1 spore coat protein [Siminovitchia acidinfaciens]
MKILLVMTADVFYLSFGRALESLGHEIFRLVTIDEKLLEEAILTFKPDMLVDMGWDVEHWKKDILAKVCKRYNLFHLYFAEEDWLHFKSWSKPYALEVSPDFVLTRSASCIPKYARIGIKSAQLDVGSNLELHRPVPLNSDFACDVSVVVNPQFKFKIFRRKSIANLVIPLFDESYNVKIWGKGWKRVKRYYKKSPKPEMLQGILPFHYTPHVYNSSKINISVQSVRKQISNRTYDILASGGFLLTSDTPAVREILRPGVHCEVSSSPEETLEKISYYLKHDQIRRDIAKKGYEYAKKKFGYQNTIPQVWPEVEEAWKKYQQNKDK